MCYVNKKEIMLLFHLRRDLHYYITSLIFYSLRTCMLNRMFFHQAPTISPTLNTVPNPFEMLSQRSRANQHPVISSSLLLRRTARHPLELPRVFPRHARLVPGAFAAFPEAVAFLADEAGVADPAVFGAVVLFSGACEGFWSVRCCFFEGECLVEWRSGGGFFVG